MYRAMPNRIRTESRSPTELRGSSISPRYEHNGPTSCGAREVPSQAYTNRLQGADSVLWMRAVTALTGVHRSTIIRWINRGEFPKKDAPHSNPNGWLRSTYDRWLLGSSPRASQIADSLNGTGRVVDVVTR
jgi:predicted DNA-binding transcriptional regulator AlpA